MYEYDELKRASEVVFKREYGISAFKLFNNGNKLFLAVAKYGSTDVYVKEGDTFTKLGDTTPINVTNFIKFNSTGDKIYLTYNEYNQINTKRFLYILPEKTPVREVVTDYSYQISEAINAINNVKEESIAAIENTGDFKNDGIEKINNVYEEKTALIKAANSIEVIENEKHRSYRK